MSVFGSVHSKVSEWLSVLGGQPSLEKQRGEEPSDVGLSQMRETVTQALQVLCDVNVEGTHWQMPPYLGTNFISTYYIVRDYFIEADNEATLHNASNTRVWPLDSRLNITLLRRQILSSQLEDGSWQNVPDPNKSCGEIDPTIFNYWALKMMLQRDQCSCATQEATSDEQARVYKAMCKAKDWILHNGGLEAANYMSKLWMAIMGVYNYDLLHEVPMMIFRYGEPLDVEDLVAQWVYPHLVPMAYIRALKLKHRSSAKKECNPYCIDELYCKDPLKQPKKRGWGGTFQSLLVYALDRGFGHNRRSLSKASLSGAVHRMLELQCPRGTFGTYTVSTLFTAVALQDYVHRFQFDPDASDAALPAHVRFALNKAHKVVESLYFPEERAAILNTGAYKGVLDDGRYWDTILAGIAACESSAVCTRPGSPVWKQVENLVIAAALHLVDQQDRTGASRDRTAPQGILPKSSVPSDCFRRAIFHVGPQGMGGIPYGEDFWYAPDIDDTAEAATLFSMALEQYSRTSDPNKIQRLSQALTRALDWLVFMQSRNGGYGAFNRDRQGNSLIRLAVRQFENAASLFDPQCADITGHVLEAYGIAGFKYTPKDDPMATTHRYTDTISRAVNYLQSTQEKDGKFWARWGINYIYGTSAAVVGLARVGVTAASPETALSNMFISAINFLLQKQNTDGGWGEAPKSYVDSTFHGSGVSTPSQTAWAIMGLLEALEQPAKALDVSKVTEAVVRGAKYLVAVYDADMPLKRGPDGKRLISWYDRCCVGTGHPKILYMQYPAYAYTFPLMALSRAVKFVESDAASKASAFCFVEGKE